MEKFNYCGISFQGRRSNNEDCYVCEKIKDDFYFFAVADGMGGALGGEVASKLIIDNSVKIVKEEAASISDPKDLKPVLERIFISGQEEISKRVKEDDSLTGMGSTLVCLIIYKNFFAWGSLGDCRLYLINNLQIDLLTKDHTYVQDFLDKNPDKTIPDSILKNFSNYLLKSIDGGKDEAEIFPRDKDFQFLEKDSVFLLCSDGLINDKATNDNQVFRDYITGHKKLKDAAENLINFAFDSGSNDNITVVLVEFGNVLRKKTNLNIYKNPSLNGFKAEMKKPGFLRFTRKFLVLIIFLLSLALAQQFFFPSIFTKTKITVDSLDVNNSMSNKKQSDTSLNREIFSDYKENPIISSKIPKEKPTGNQQLEKPKVKTDSSVVSQVKEIIDKKINDSIKVPDSEGRKSENDSVPK